VTVFGWLFVAMLGTLLWPLNIPLMAAAYRVRLGQHPLPFEGTEFWVRSLFASLGMAVLGWVVVLLHLLLVRGIEVPPMMSLTIVLIIYVPIALPFLHWIMAFDEFVEAISLFLLYLLLPGVPFLLLGWIFRLAERAARYAS
jgi:hypothetical protein